MLTNKQFKIFNTVLYYYSAQAKGQGLSLKSSTVCLFVCLFFIIIIFIIFILQQAEGQSGSRSNFGSMQFNNEVLLLFIHWLF